MKEIDNNSMKPKNCFFHYHFLVYEKPIKKSPHKYIGGKKKKAPIKIKSTGFTLSFLVQYLHHTILVILSNSKYPSDFYLYFKFSSINSV